MVFLLLAHLSDREGWLAGIVTELSEMLRKSAWKPPFQLEAILATIRATGTYFASPDRLRNVKWGRNWKNDLHTSGTRQRGPKSWFFEKLLIFDKNRFLLKMVMCLMCADQLRPRNFFFNWKFELSAFQKSFLGTFQSKNGVKMAIEASKNAPDPEPILLHRGETLRKCDCFMVEKPTPATAAPHVGK